MLKKSPVLVLLALIVVLALAGCRSDEETTPTAVPPTPAAETATTEPETEAAATEPAPMPTSTAVPAAAEPTTMPAGTAFDQPIPPEDIDWPPQVVFSDPLPGAQIELTTPILLRFDQTMDQDSVEAAWDIEPSVAGSFEWPTGDTLVFTPQGELERGQTYRVQLGDTAVSQNGLALEEPVSFDLQTVGFLQVSETLPAEGSRRVQADGAITVVFNKPVVPLTSTGQQANLPQPLTIEPPAEGQGEWVSTSIYRFVPEPAFAGATTYRVTIDAGLTDVTGSTLEAPVSWQFTTEDPSVVSIMPADRASLVLPTQPISITFNMPMDTAVTEAAVSLSADGAPAPALSTAWEEGDRLLILTPDEPLALESTYQLVVGAGATAATGTATLDEETTSSFATVPFPAVLETMPSNGGMAERWQRGVNIQFASPMDIDTLEDRIQIEPTPDDINYYYNEYIDRENPGNSNFSLYLDFDLERSAEYVVTIPGDAADPYGNTLGEDVLVRFSTPTNAPVVSLNLLNPVSQISTSFPSDVEIIHRNVSRLEVTLTDLGLPTGLLAEGYLPYDVQPRGEVVGEWSIPVETSTEEVGLTTVSLAEGGTLSPGVYFLEATSPQIAENDRYWQTQRVILIVGDTNLVVKEMPDEVRAWATDLETGQPAAGRDLTFYGRNGRQLGTAVTDENGFARIDYQPMQNYLEGVLAISNAPGEAGFGASSSYWTGGYNVWRQGINYQTGGYRPLFTYIYTDRPIYRPGDTVYFKGILREANFARYNLPEPQTLRLNVATNFYSEEQGYSEVIPVEVNADGIFSGEIVLPDDIRLGSYNIYVEGEEVEGARTFTVAEYRKPEFQVTLTPETTDALRGDTVDVTLDAEYFFGGSPQGLTVQWTIYEQAFSPDVPGPYYSFTDQADFFYQDYGLFGPPTGGMLGRYVTGGEGKTDANGRFTITLPADLLDDVDEGSREVTVEALVADIANFPVSSRTTVLFHGAEVYVGVRPTEYAPSSGTEVSVELLTVDWDGSPVPERDVEVIFYEREWESERNDQYGVYYTQWTPIDTEVARTSVTTDDLGEASASFVPENGGEYLAVATVTDGDGRTHTSSTFLWVVDAQYAGWRTDPREKSMDLVPEQTAYSVGETANILVQSPFEGPLQAWLTFERGNLIEQQVITLQGGSEVLALPIKPEYAPNVYVSVIPIKPVTPENADNPFADIRVGVVELQVAPEQFALNVQLTPQAEQFAPGDTVVYDILVTDNSGSPVANADLSLALADLAVLTLKEDNAPPILEAFYSPLPLASQTGSGLLVSGEGLEPEIPLEGGGLGGGGGDGIAEAALAPLEEEDETRRDFPDTAYWEASIKTDSNGRATVEIALPDSLTTWRLSSKGVTTDTQVGQSSTDVVATLPLLIRPVAPRFFTVGDVVQLGAIVNNNTSDPIDATVSLEAAGLTLNSDAVQAVDVPANGRQLVRWEVVVDDVEFADLTFRVEGGGYRDATKPTLGVGPNNLLPVYRYNARDIVGTAGELDEAGRRVEAVALPPFVDTRRGSVDMQLNASLAAALIDALEAVEREEINPACAGMLADRLLPNVATAQALDKLNLDNPALAERLDEIVPLDIAQLQSQQKSDGGWGWCYAEESDPWLSAYALLALTKASMNGYTVDLDTLRDGAGYIERQLADPEDLNLAWEVNRQAFFLYVLSEADNAVAEDADALFEAQRGLLDPYGKALLVLIYARSGGDSAVQQDLLNDLNDEVVLSATGAHWEDAEQDFFNLNSDIRGTAVVIDALSLAEPDSSLLPPAVRWLMAAREVQIWSTLHETAWSIYALADWMAASGELDPDYSYSVSVNAVPLTDGTFTPETVAETQSLSVPVSSLLTDGTNFFDFQRGEGNGRLYYTLHLNSFIAAEAVQATNHGFAVQRAYYDAACDPEETTCEPIDTIAAGQRVRVELTIIVPNDRLYAIVEDPLPAGAEAIDPGLETSASGLGGEVRRTDQEYRYGYWGWWYFNNIEYRDEQVVFTSSFLPAGTYQYTYHLQTNIPGEYQVMPAIGYESYFPEVFGRSDGMRFTITGE